MTFKRVLIGIGVLVVLGGLGLFVLDRTIFAPIAVSTEVPVAPTLPAPTAVADQPTSQPAGQTQAATQPGAAASTTSTAGAQRYRIDASQSEVRYEVDETFFNENNRLNTAIGRTKGIAGDLLIDFAKPSNSQVGEIVIDVSQFTSDESRRDNFIRRNGLNSSQYPKATFVTKSIQGLPAQVAVGDQVSFKISGDLTVKETTKPVIWDVTLKLGDKRLEGSATTQILMSDFGVGPLKLPMLQTKDDVKLVFDFVALPA
jgi:polyisoprenoid-binding protein YceI